MIKTDSSSTTTSIYLSDPILFGLCCSFLGVGVTVTVPFYSSITPADIEAESCFHNLKSEDCEVVFSAVVGSCLGSKSLNPSNCNYALPYTFLSIMIYTVIRWLFRSWCAFPFNNHQPWPPWWPPHAPSASRCPSRWWWDRSMAWGKSEEWDSQNDGFSYWMIIIPNIIIYIYTHIYVYIYTYIYIYWLIGEYNPELLINQGFEHCSIELPSLPAKNIV